MPVNIQVIHAREFIRATPDGVHDREGSLKVLREIADVGAGLARYHVILDTRKATLMLTLTDLWFLAEGMAQMRGAYQGMTAVLCPADREDFAEFFALCASNRGLLVSAFTSFEDAIEWLIGEWIAGRPGMPDAG